MTFCTCEFITDLLIASYHEISSRSQLKTSWPPLMYSISYLCIIWLRGHDKKKRELQYNWPNVKKFLKQFSITL